MANEYHNQKKALRLTGAIILNFLITVAEILGGVISGSLSLLSDAIHNFSDGIALIISGFAWRIGKQPKSVKYTFGKKRAEILAAVINAVVLVVICIFLIKESYERILNPKIPSGMIMVGIGTLGLFANMIGMLLLHSSSILNLNFRSAYLHLLSDTICSLGVILGGLAIRFFSIAWIDPLITILISAYVIWESYDILKSAIDIMMMAAPSSISLEEVSAFICTLPAIENVHHAHLWQMSEDAIHFEAHIRVKDMPVSATEKLLHLIETQLQKQFGIHHVTIQCECDRCDTQSLIA